MNFKFIYNYFIGCNSFGCVYVFVNNRGIFFDYKPYICIILI